MTIDKDILASDIPIFREAWVGTLWLAVLDSFDTEGEAAQEFVSIFTGISECLLKLHYNDERIKDRITQYMNSFGKDDMQIASGTILEMLVAMTEVKPLNLGNEFSRVMSASDDDINIKGGT